MLEVFGLTKPLWEIALRATVVYLALVLVLRAIPKRNAGSISPNDMLTLIVIGGTGADAIMGGSTSVGDILLMIGLVVTWGYVLDFLEYRFPFLQWILRDRQTGVDPGWPHAAAKHAARDGHGRRTDDRPAQGGRR